MQNGAAEGAEDRDDGDDDGDHPGVHDQEQHDGTDQADEDGARADELEDDRAAGDRRVGRLVRRGHRCSAAAACTASTIGSQSAPGVRVMVTKSFTPKMDATPGAANTASANGLPAAAPASAMFMVSAS